MQIFKKNFYLIILLFILLTGCKSLKDGLEGNKKTKSAEEFLIQKKNPLVLPPDYSKLPLPKGATLEELSSDEYDLQKILNKKSKSKDKTNLESNKTSDLKKSVIEKIKNN